MAESYSLCLIGAMDRLWFQQIILFSESTTLFVPKALRQHQLVTESFAHLSSSFPLTTPSKEKVSSVTSSSLPEDEFPHEAAPASLQTDTHNEKGGREKDLEPQERPTRLNHITQRARAHSSSPSSCEKRPKTMRRSSSSVRILNKTMSCRTLGELELEEVKGFMDLGFQFKQEYLSPRMMSVVPGLQRLGLDKNILDPNFFTNTGLTEDDRTGKEEERRGITRPYLSEAWLIRRPDSPLLNLRIPKVTAAGDMKKHLRSWARTVAQLLEQGR